MRSNVYKEARIAIYVFALILVCSVLFYLFAAMFTSMGYEGFRKSKTAENNVLNAEKTIVVIDAGHGGEDPGASANNLIEKELNLEIASKLNDYLCASGYETVMTRTQDNLLYNNGEEGRKKYFDLKNRKAIAEKYDNAIFISIHMNKFPAEYCKGLQVFYSDNNENSNLLAESIQNNARILQTDNKRKIKNGNQTIYLMDNLNIPAVLVECGFLSNAEEANSLSNDDYKQALSLTLYCGIVEFLEN